MKNMFKVYLAGPITGCTYDGCTDWREEAMIILSSYDIHGLSPMRHKDYLNKGDAKLKVAGSYPDSVLSSQRGIFARDSWDCRECDAILVNLLGAETVSVGTVMEIAWGHAYNKPVLLVMEKDNNIHDHAMLREACPFRVDNLDEAYDVLKALFTSAPH